MSTPDERKMLFKNRGALSAVEIRRRRDDHVVELRKTKKDESLSKRRNMVVVSKTEESLDTGYIYQLIKGIIS
jgi:importin subunit alpha-1